MQQIILPVSLMILFGLYACGNGGPDKDADAGTDLAVDEISDLDTAAEGDIAVDPDADAPADLVPDGEDDAVSDTAQEPDAGEDTAGDVDEEDTSDEEVEPECVEEGGSGPVVPDAPDCCEGLTRISCATPDSSGLCREIMGVFCCSYCGNAECGLGENYCNCPEDCGEEDCVGEGDSYPVVPDHLDCCPGLVPVGCDVPGPDGSCIPCDGAVFCTRCGDGTCGLGENICRCHADCS